MDGGGMFFGGGFMWIFWIILFIAIIWAVKAAMDSGNSGNSNSSNSESPMEVLRKRYANGEIDEEEFNRRRKELEK
jgi:putative membrane protein